MYGRDVVAWSTCGPYKVRGKALEWGSMSIRSLCLFYFSFGLIARTRCAGRRSSKGGVFWVIRSYEVRGKALRYRGGGTRRGGWAPVGRDGGLESVAMVESVTMGILTYLGA